MFTIWICIKKKVGMNGIVKSNGPKTGPLVQWLKLSLSTLKLLVWTLRFDNRSPSFHNFLPLSSKICFTSSLNHSKHIILKIAMSSRTHSTNLCLMMINFHPDQEFQIYAMFGSISLIFSFLLFSLNKFKIQTMP